VRPDLHHGARRLPDYRRFLGTALDIVGEAWSTDQGRVEGALQTSEAVLRDAMRPSEPAWLKAARQNSLPSGSGKSGSHETPRWREQDSNHRSPAREMERKAEGIGLFRGTASVGRGRIGEPAKHPLVGRHRMQLRRVRHRLERSFSDAFSDLR